MPGERNESGSHARSRWRAKLFIADEDGGGVDVSTQAQVVHCVEDLQTRDEPEPT
jgi:ABC-type dipeptide/oligopeptide/nickel transport system ATPase component